MLFIKLLGSNQWLKLYKEKMLVFDFNGDYRNLTNEELESSKMVECDGWHELYKMKKWCPLEVSVNWPDVWISPNGIFFNGKAHETRAEELLEILYGETNVCCPGDRLEELGFIRATISLMWDIRIDSNYWNEKKIKQKQYDSLWDWCKFHKKKFPKNIVVV